ncbi:hypothetical protein ES703_94254 [subsurface metagenome]
MISLTMGVQPRPPDNRPQDHFCWPAGQTPWTIKVFVSGIKFGWDWDPGDGMLPNGYYDMVRQGQGSNEWISPGPGAWAALSLTHAESQLGVRSDGGRVAFWDEDLFNTCEKYFHSTMRPAGNAFYGGDAWVTGYEFPWDIAELVMNAYWKDPRYECFPMPSEQLAIRVARIQDGTNIMIKFDHNL